MKFSPLLGFGAFILLSACLGDSSGGDTGSGTGPGTVGFDELTGRLDAFEDTFGTLDVDSTMLAAQATPSENIPTTGSASYTGAAFIGIETNANNPDSDIAFGALGSTTMVANFADQSISGTADSFFLLDDPNALTVSDLSGQAINASMTYELEQDGNGDNLFSGQFDGSLSIPGQGDLTISVPGGGGFVGDNLEGFVADAFNSEGEFAGIWVTKD